MRTDLQTVHPGQKLSEVYDLVKGQGIHHVPVVEGDRLVGILSAADLLRFTYGNTYEQDERTLKQSLELTSIREAMTEDLVTIDADAFVKDAVSALSRGDIHALPVIEGDKLAGMVTSTDLIRFLGEQY